MNFKSTILIFFSAFIFTLLLILAIGQIQLFSQVRGYGIDKVSMGYPYSYFSFRMHNGVSVTNPVNLMLNFIISYPIILAIFYGIKKIFMSKTLKEKNTNGDQEIIDN